jgi:thiosulfate/3-mercaptopyruvate sulfurtransferase
MTQTISPIIHAAELLALHKNDNLILIDASNGKDTKANYEAKHLDGALFVDMNTQLADMHEDLSHGGRHPLPSIANFSKTLTELGISKESHVVIYDDKNGANAASRFWWMLKSVGHEKVQVLNGGFQAAEKIGFPTNSEKVMPSSAKASDDKTKKSETYTIEKWHLPLSNIAEVEKVSENKNYIVVDVRDSIRYRGEKEPIDSIAGHIPGSINAPFIENLDENGFLLAPEILRAKYQAIFDNKPIENIIFHCGSGVTACQSLLSIAYAGLELPKLYIGSWSEWSNSNKSIVKEQ